MRMTVFSRVEVDVRGVDDRLRAGRLGADVIAVEGDVEIADRQLGLGQLGEEACRRRASRAPRVWIPTIAKAIGLRILLGDLVRDSPQRSRQIVVLQHDLLVHSLLLLPGLAGPG